MEKNDSQKQEEKILDEIRRAKLRALRLLESMDRTEANVREKLQKAEFSETAINEAVAYVKSYGYLDDVSYVKKYIESKSRTKSRKQIEAELIYQKGVDKSLVLQGFETAWMEDPQNVILKFVRKKGLDPQQCTYEERQKFFAYMMRKGFQKEDLKKVFDLT